MDSLPYQTISVLLLLISGALAASIGEYIHGGEIANETSQFPYLVSLRRGNGNSHMCGATILSNRFIITAGHCYSNSVRLNEYRIVIGALHREDIGTKYTLKRFTVHPNYTLTTIDTLRNDIAIIELNEEISFDDNVSPIDIGREFIGENVPALTSGWGRTEVCWV